MSKTSSLAPAVAIIPQLLHTASKLLLWLPYARPTWNSSAPLAALNKKSTLVLAAGILHHVQR